MGCKHEPKTYARQFSNGQDFLAAGFAIVWSFVHGTAMSAPPEELVPDSQFARLGYVEFGRAVAARDDVVLAASRAYSDELLWNYNGGNWVDAFRHDGDGWIDEAGLVAMGGDSSVDPPMATDDFGAAVALTPTGHVALVGAPKLTVRGQTVAPFSCSARSTRVGTRLAS